jgi:hypothetical protein
MKKYGKSVKFVVTHYSFFPIFPLCKNKTTCIFMIQYNLCCGNFFSVSPVAAGYIFYTARLGYLSSYVKNCSYIFI